MKLPPARIAIDRLGPVPFGLLVAAFVLLAAQDSAGFVAGAIAATVGLTLSALWRIAQWPIGGGPEVIPATVALLYLVLATTPSFVAEASAGLAGAVMLLWLAEISSRSPGRFGKALDQLVLPLAGFGIALGISFVLPSGPLSLGVASLLLVLVVILVVVILARPAIVGRREAPSS